MQNEIISFCIFDVVMLRCVEVVCAIEDKLYARLFDC